MAVAVLSAAFAGLVSAGSEGPGAAPNQAPSTLRIGALQEPDSLNPFIGVLTQSCVIWAQVYALLVAIGPDLQPYPSLAYDWEVDAAGLNWTFDLLDNATWHDGVPFTAEGVKFTLRYNAPPRNGSQRLSLCTPIPPPSTSGTRAVKTRPGKRTSRRSGRGCTSSRAGS